VNGAGEKRPSYVEVNMNGTGWWGDVIDRMSAYHTAHPENMPGAVFGVETPRSGRLVSAVGDCWGTDSICAIASMTKPFTATALLLALEEHGLLDVEMPVFELPGMGLYSRDEVKRKIRVRHLLQHTSGLPSFQHYSRSPATRCNDPEGAPPCCADLDDPTGPTSQWTGSPGITNECIHVDRRCRPARAASLEKVSEFVMQAYCPAFEPGTESSYTTYAFTVVARAVEMLTGESINRYLRRRVFEPLGMPDSFFVAEGGGDDEAEQRITEGVSDEQKARIADVTLITQDGKLPEEIAPGRDGHWDKLRRGWKYVFPEGGMYSTAEDLLAYLAMLRDGGMSRGRQVISKEIVSLLVDDQGFGHTMGFGYAEKKNRYGNGVGTLSHLGRFMTYIWYDPDRNNPVIGVFLSQRLTNLFAIRNLAEGTRVIFSEFVPLVTKCASENFAEV
jgi:CubicO group peptidase (beta-lactamase class C family)